MTAPLASRSPLLPAGLGVAIGFLAMLIAAVYSFEASTEPERGWTPLDGRGVVLVGCLGGVLAGWIACWRAARLRAAEDRSSE